jgi:hypothetical protein
LRLSGVYDPYDGIRIGDVAWNRQRVSSTAPDQIGCLRQRLRSSRSQGHPGASIGKGQRKGASKTGAAARHERNLSR